MMFAADWRLVLAIGGAAGLLISPFWNPGGEWPRVLVALVLARILFIDRGQLKGVAMVLVGAAAVMAGLLVGGDRLEAIDGSALEGRPGPVQLHGFALESPSESRGTARFAVSTDRGRVLVETTPGKATEVSPGTGLELDGTLGHAPEWMRADLERQGIRMVLRAETVRPDGRHRSGLSGLVDRMRERAMLALGTAVPEREAALSRGFVLGDDSGIDPRTVEDFRRSGLSHLLAVSGQNVVLLSLLAIPFLALLGIGPRARLAAIAVLILIYIPLAGGGPSIQRAGVMGIAGLVAIAATRAPSRIYALALAALVTLGLNPRASGDIGWQLSFAAVIGIMLLARPVQARLEPLVGSTGWRRAFAEGLAVTLAATIATAPLTAFHFERLPVATILANLAAMPAVAPAMWAGMIGVAAGQLSPALAVPFNLGGSVFLGWIAQVAEWFGRPGWAVVELKIGSPIALGAVTLILTATCVALLRLWRVSRVPVRPGRWLAAAAALLIVAAILVPSLLDGGRRDLRQPPAGGARVEVLDVGQGDAILIRPTERDPILIDGGPPGGDLAGALASAGVDRLAAVILTHPDLDHYGGLLDLFGLMPVDRFLFDNSPPELLELAVRSGAATARLQAGDSIASGGVRLEVLWPPELTGPVPPAGETETNLRSIVALLEWRKFRMLLTGDAEAGSVPMHPGPIDVLKVSHHGSEDPGLPGLLAETSPRVAVISVGEDNSYGHPVAGVIDELSTDGVETLRTDEDGTVSIVLGGGSGYRVESGR